MTTTAGLGHESGSGIRTVLLTVNLLALPPFCEGLKPSEYIFAIEEPENQLHPALLRRLLAWLFKFSDEHDCPILVTSHSSAAIDMFVHHPEVRIIHLTHDGVKTSASSADSFFDRSRILDDLDVRASDLLQANGVIWVEGPSDRTYINTWISLWSGDRFREGVDYQCVFDGGALRSHQTADEPQSDGDQKLISVLRVNRHSIIVMRPSTMASTSVGALAASSRSSASV